MASRRGMRSERPLTGKRILVARAGADASRLRAHLEPLGAEVLELPTIAIAPPEDWEPVDAALSNLSRFDWFVFPSRNAVSAVVERRRHLGLPATFPQNLRVGAVGPSTAAELEGNGIEVECVPIDARAVGLVRSMAEMGIERARVLLATGNLSRPELRQGLEEAGAIVQQVTVYRTVQPPTFEMGPLEALRRGEVDVVVLGSPSTLRNLVEMLGPDLSPLQSVLFACMGPTTAAAVRELGLEPAIIASPPTFEGLIRSMIAHFDPEHSHEQS